MLIPMWALFIFVFAAGVATGAAVVWLVFATPRF